MPENFYIKSTMQKPSSIEFYFEKYRHVVFDNIQLSGSTYMNERCMYVIFITIILCNLRKKKQTLKSI